MSLGIAVCQVLQKTNDGYLVDFDSEWGSGRAVWHGDSPEKKMYVVELSVDDELRWGTNIELADDNTYRIYSDQEMLVIQGRVGDFYENHAPECLEILMGDPILDTIYLPACQDTFKVGDFVKASCKNVRLFDCKYI